MSFGRTDTQGSWFITSVFCLTGGGQPFLRHGRVGFPEQRDALPMQVRRGAGLHARLPRRYGRKTMLPVHFNAVLSPFHHAFFFFSRQATLTAPRRKTCLTTSVKSPTTSCELGWGRGHTESKRKQLHDLLPHLNTSGEGPTTETRQFNRETKDDEGGGTIRIPRTDDRRLLF